METTSAKGAAAKWLWFETLTAVKAALLQAFSLTGRSLKWTIWRLAGSWQVISEWNEVIGCLMEVVSKYHLFSHLPSQEFVQEHTRWLFSSLNPPWLRLGLKKFKQLFHYYYLPARCLVDVADNELLFWIDCSPILCNELSLKSRVNDAHPSSPLINRSGRYLTEVFLIQIKCIKTQFNMSEHFFFTLREMPHSGSVWNPVLANTSGWMVLRWAPEISISLSLGAVSMVAM